MADQQNRGGKKQGAEQPDDRRQHQGVDPAKPRPAEGQPGGPKEKGKSGRDRK